MRILHCVPSVNPVSGGPIEGITRLGEALRLHGCQSEIVSLDAPSDAWVARCPLTVHATGPSIGRYGYNRRFTKWLKAKARDYDVVVIDGIWQYSSFGAWRALHKSVTPYVAFTHGMLDPWFKERYPLKHLKKWLYWPYADYRVLRDARGVIFTSEEERMRARESFWLYRAVERVVVYGTADPKSPNDSRHKEAFLQAFPAARGRKCILYLGRVHPKKGCDILLQAFAKVASTAPKLHLVIAGPDVAGWQSELERLTHALNISQRITWTGALSGSEKWGAFRAADAFILPSHQENFGVAVAEALACNLPVLITDKVNIWREIVADGAGMVAPDTEAGITSLLFRWLKIGDAERARMSENARRCFESRFDMQATAGSFLDVLAGLGISA